MPKKKQDVKVLNLPVVYEAKPYNDDRFTKVRITVMHDGMNLNGSNFSLEAMEAAKDSIQNIPILAFVKQQDGTDDSDFAGHEAEIVWGTDDIKFRYLGRPIGIIPGGDESDYHIEVRDDKHYVVVDGYIWNDYANEALEILERDGIKGQSMEIRVDEYNWVDTEDDFYVDIKKYRYTGLCLLGDDVTPAMTGAKAEVVSFSVNDQKKYNQAIQELSMAFSKKPESEKGGEEDMKLKELLAKHGFETVEELEAKLAKEPVDTSKFEQKISSLEAEKEELGQKVTEFKTKIAEKDESISSMSSELEELRNYKAETEREKHEAAAEEVMSKFAKVLKQEDISDIDVHAYSDLGDLEKELAHRAWKKNGTITSSNFSKKEEPSIKLSVKNEAEDEESHPLAKFF